MFYFDKNVIFVIPEDTDSETCENSMKCCLTKFLNRSLYSISNLALLLNKWIFKDHCTGFLHFIELPGKYHKYLINSFILANRSDFRKTCGSPSVKNFK